MDWGFKDELIKHGLSTRASTFISSKKLVARSRHFTPAHKLTWVVDTGEVIGCLEWKEDVLQETGADYLVIRVSLYLEYPEDYSFCCHFLDVHCSIRTSTICYIVQRSTRVPILHTLRQ